MASGVVERIFDYFFGAGPLGIIIVLLLVCIITLGRVCIVLFRMYQESIEKRLSDSIAFHDSVRLLTIAIDGLRNGLSISRRR